MSDKPRTDATPLPLSLPVVEHARTPVPVFDCHVLLFGPDDRGLIVARSTKLPHVTGRGATERDALLAVVAEFKQELRRYVERGEPIPWTAQPLVKQPGQQERWIPVHL